MRVVLLLFDQVDLLDVGGPYEVFLTANRLAERDGQPAVFEVLTVSVGDRPVHAYGGLLLGPTTPLADAVGSEVVVVPGAVDLETVLADAAVRSAVDVLTSAAKLSSSVCTGAFLLANAGLLDGRECTTHWEDVPRLADRLGDAARVTTAAWVDSGPVVTAGGLSCGIAMALHLVERLAGRSAAVAVARQIDYSWQPTNTDQQPTP